MSLEPSLLALVPGCEDGRAPIALEPLTGGSVNRTLLVHTRAGRFVVRISGAAAARLGVNRRREAGFQALAATAGLAPRIVAASLDARVLVAEYVPGRVWSAADLEDRGALERLGERLGALERLPVPPELATPRFEPLRETRRLAQQLLAAEPADAPLVERLLADAERNLAAGGAARAPVAVHLDLHPGNLVEGERLVLLDWEYAACGDPALELASLLAAAAESREAELDRLRGVMGLEVSRVELAALRRVFEATHWFWYRARRLDRRPTAPERAAEAALLARLVRGG